MNASCRFSITRLDHHKIRDRCEIRLKNSAMCKKSSHFKFSNFVKSQSISKCALKSSVATTFAKSRRSTVTGNSIFVTNLLSGEVFHAKFVSRKGKLYYLLPLAPNCVLTLDVARILGINVKITRSLRKEGKDGERDFTLVDKLESIRGVALRLQVEIEATSTNLTKLTVRA